MSKAKVVDLFGFPYRADEEAPNDGCDDAREPPPNADDTIHTNAKDEPPEYRNHSKEKYTRLYPYFQNVLAHLASSSNSYTLPADLFTRIAEAYNIKKGDIFADQLMLIIGKLKPYITAKTGNNWPYIERNIIRPHVRQHRADHYSTNSYTLDTIPDSEWFPPFDDNNMPQPSYMNIALALIRYPHDLLRYDEFDDMYHVTQKDGQIRAINSDNIVAPLLEILHDTFYGKPVDDRHFRRAIGIIRSRKLNEFHSCKDYVDLFEPHYDPTYDWVSKTCHGR